MPYNLDILIDNRVVLQTIIGAYTYDVVSSLCKETAAILDACKNEKVIVMADLTKVHTMENNIIRAREAAKPLFTHPNHLMTIGYGTSDKVVANFMANSVAGLFRQPVRSLATEAEAVKFIITKYPDLAENLPQALKDFHNRKKS